MWPSLGHGSQCVWHVSSLSSDGRRFDVAQNISGYAASFRKDLSSLSKFVVVLRLRASWLKTEEGCRLPASGPAPPAKHDGSSAQTAPATSFQESRCSQSSKSGGSWPHAREQPWRTSGAFSWCSAAADVDHATADATTCAQEQSRRHALGVVSRAAYYHDHCSRSEPAVLFMLLPPGGGGGGGGLNRPKAATSAKFSSKWTHIRDICLHDMKVVLGRMSPSFCNLNQLQNLDLDKHFLLFEYGTGFSRDNPIITHSRADLSLHMSGS